VQVSQNTSFQTAGSTSNTASLLAGLAFQSTPFVGMNWYGLIALRTLPSASNLSRIESYLGSKCGL
jgi:hypothetical protein